jgi:hypothetical protein
MKPIRDTMRLRLVQVCLIGLIALQPSCTIWHHWIDARHAVKKLAWLETAHAEQDLAAAVLTDDLRFVGVYREKPEVPGVEGENEALPATNGVRYLEGTSVVTHGEKQKKLNRAAQKYAARYNKLLLVYLKRGKIKEAAAAAAAGAFPSSRPQPSPERSDRAAGVGGAKPEE